MSTDSTRNCPDCGGAVGTGDEDYVCPHCGFHLEAAAPQSFWRSGIDTDSGATGSLWQRAWYSGLLPAVIICVVIQIVALSWYGAMGPKFIMSSNMIVFGGLGLGMGALTRGLRGILIGVLAGAVFGVIATEVRTIVVQLRKASLPLGEHLSWDDPLWMIQLAAISALPLMGMSVVSRWMPSGRRPPWSGIVLRGGAALAISIVTQVFRFILINALYRSLPGLLKFHLLVWFILSTPAGILCYYALLFRSPLIARPPDARPESEFE